MQGSKRVGIHVDVGVRRERILVYPQLLGGSQQVTFIKQGQRSSSVKSVLQEVPDTARIAYAAMLLRVVNLLFPSSRSLA